MDVTLHIGKLAADMDPVPYTVQRAYEEYS